MQEASALSKLAMNAAQMGAAAAAGVFDGAAGPGWALAACGIGMVGTVPLLLRPIRAGRAAPGQASLLRDLREGWAEFASHTWLWATTAQFCACWPPGTARSTASGRLLPARTWAARRAWA